MARSDEVPKVALWEALMSCDRIRLIGSTKFGDGKLQHVGFEFWDTHPDKEITPKFEEFARAMIPPESAQDKHYAAALEWLRKNPSHWDDHPDYPVEDWRSEIADNYTRQSYRDWILSQAEIRDDNES